MKISLFVSASVSALSPLHLDTVATDWWLIVCGPVSLCVLLDLSSFKCTGSAKGASVLVSSSPSPLPQSSSLGQVVSRGDLSVGVVLGALSHHLLPSSYRRASIH